MIPDTTALIPYARFLLLLGCISLAAADRNSTSVQPLTAEQMHQSAVSRPGGGSETTLELLKSAYEGRLAGLGATNPKTIESLEQYCQTLLETGTSATNLGYFSNLVATSSKAFAPTSEQVLRSTDMLLDAQIAMESANQDELRVRGQLAELGLQVDPAQLQSMQPEEVMRLLQSTAAGRAVLEQAESNRKQNEVAALQALQNPTVQGIMALNQARELQSLRERGISDTESQRLIQEYHAAVASHPTAMRPGESPQDFQHRMSELVRTNPAALNSPQLRTNPLSQPWRPPDPRNADRRIVEAAVRTNPEGDQTILMSGVVKKFASDPRDFCAAQLQQINNSFEGGTVPGYIIGFRRLEIPGSALEDALVMASITASLKGAVMHRETLMLHELARSNDPAVSQWRRDIWKLTTQLAKLQTEVFQVGRPGPGSGENFHPVPNYEAYNEVRTRLGSLRRMAASLTDPGSCGLVDLAKCSQALPSDAVFVGYIRYTPDLGGTNLLKDYYGASILKPDGRMAWVPLGPADRIDAMVGQYFRWIEQEGDPGTQAQDFEAICKDVAGCIWRPVADTFPTGTRQVILSPDSELNRLSFPALFDGSRFLAEDFVIRLVSSCRELLNRPQPPAQEKTVSLWGDPVFGNRSADGRGIKGLNFGQLPASKAEVEILQRLASTQGYAVSLHEGVEATEQSFASLESPRFLHVATHGLILPLPRSQRTNTFQVIPDDFKREMDRELLPYRAALGFSGLNPGLDSWSTSGISEPGPDGLLTSFEASRLELQDTELVTLSACDSGSGTISPGEGVYSLRRAFHLAGARLVVASLWRINDRYAPVFFEKYYSKVFAGTEPAVALAEVQAGELRRLRLGKEGGSLRDAVRLAGPFLISGIAPKALRD